MIFKNGVKIYLAEYSRVGWLSLASWLFSAILSFGRNKKGGSDNPPHSNDEVNYEAFFA